MRLLLDEMYGARLARALQAVGIDASTVLDHRLTGAADPEVFAVALTTGRGLLTENVADFTQLVGEHSAAGGQHHGLLIALSSRFSRRPAGIGALVAALHALAQEDLTDRVVYLEFPRPDFPRA